MGKPGRGVITMSSGGCEKYFNQLPKYFFVTGGKALSPVSALNAFDEALIDAGIEQCNLVPVSSILPANAVEVDYVPITPGAIVFTVMARADGGPGDALSAGVAWAFGEREDGVRYGFIVESYGKVPGTELREDLERKILRMASVRNMKVDNIRFRIESIDKVPEGMYGSAVAALIFVPIIDHDKVRVK